MENKFTKEELGQLFPNGVTLLFMKLLFPESSRPLTLDELRRIASLLRDDIAAAEKRGRIEERAKISALTGYIEDANGNKGWIVP